LGSGVIEFTGLPYNNGPGADDQDFLNIPAFGHYSLKFFLSVNGLKINSAGEFTENTESIELNLEKDFFLYFYGLSSYSNNLT
jgi:hypothetical protein